MPGLAALPRRRGLAALPDDYAMLVAEAQSAALQDQPASFAEMGGTDPFEAAAIRTRRGVRPEGGRKEGQITAGLEAVPQAVAQSLYSGATLPHDVGRGAIDPFSAEGVGRLGDMATFAVGPTGKAAGWGLREAANLIKAAPRTTAAAIGGAVTAAPAATAGDPGDEFGILRPQISTEPQPRPAIMPDESQMPEQYRQKPALRRRWYEAEVQKLAPINAQRQSEDAAMRDEWRKSTALAQDQYSAKIEAARKARADEEANKTFLERNPEYRYVPLGASLVSGGVANVLSRVARGPQKAWNTGLQNLTNEARTAVAAGDVPRSQQLRNSLDTYLSTPEPSGKLPWYGYAAAAGIAPEFAAAPTIIDYATPGRPREEAKKDLQDPSYWAKTYAVPGLLGLSAAKTGAMLNRPVQSAAPAARGAMAEIDTAAAQAAAREQSALSAAQAEQARLQAILDEQAAKRAAAAEKARATREAKRVAEEAAARNALRGKKKNAIIQP